MGFKTKPRETRENWQKKNKHLHFVFNKTWVNGLLK